MKKVVSLFLAILMVMSLVACGGGAKEDAPKQDAPKQDAAGSESAGSDSTEVKYKERAIIGYSGTLGNSDPHVNTAATNMFIWRLTHDTLVDYNTATSEVDPGLAESWDVDGLTYTFHLRKGVTFHNGNPFTAEDVIYSFDRMAAGGGTKAYVQSIVSKEIVDDHTVKFTLSAPNAEFLLCIGDANMVILDKETIDEVGEEKGTLIGTGAFSLTEWVPDDYCMVTRFDDYWGEAPITKEIVLRKYSEASARAIALQTGEIDVDMALAAIEVPHIEECATTEVVQVPAAKLVYIALNTRERNKPLTDVRVRQALNYAMNSEDFIIAVREGYASAPNGCIPVGVWGYSEDVDAYEYNPEKAKELLAEAGYGDGLDLTLTTNGSQYPGIFEVLQAQWAEVGVNLTLETDDATIYNDQAASGEYCMMTRNYNFSGIDRPLRTLWYSTSTGNRTKTNDPKLDAMLDAALSEMDTAKREAMYAEISQYITDLASFIPLYQDQLLIGQGKNVSGVYYGPVTNHNLQNIAVAIED